MCVWAVLGAAHCPAQARIGVRDATGQRGMVVSTSPEGSDVGLAILKRGGNAVDAAVATAFAMAVTHPAAGNIGGGGFMLIYPADGRPPGMIDYREKAPIAATRNMFINRTSHDGHKVVGVPGTVRGLWLAHQTYGSLEWAALVEPAVALARDGFHLSGGLARSLNGAVGRITDFPEFRRTYGKDGGKPTWKPGDRFIQADLAKTLDRIRVLGYKGFYSGETASLLIDEMKRGGGLITQADLDGYQAVIREPIHATFRGYDVYGPPPPSSGGICLTEMLNILEHFDLKSMERWSPETNHLIIETMRRAYCDRAKFLGDTDFVSIPPYLTSKAYAKKLASGIDRTRATPSESLAAPIQLADEGTETTHFSVIDRNGMAVSNTYTLERGFGSKVVVRGAGFLLNNEMGDFNWKPGVTDRHGRIGTPANEIRPAKRMLSSMTPVIASRHGKVVLVTGSPGGRTIINTVLCVTLNVLEFGMDLRPALDAPRLDQEWFPDRVTFGSSEEDVAYPDLVPKLRLLGHDVRIGHQGDANSILVKHGVIHGAADNRWGKASGF